MPALSRRSFTAVALATALLATSTVSAEYPEKPVTIVVAWAAGGATDLVTRALQPVLGKQLGADLVVKNITGAAGTIGTAEAARARPDGYTVLITPTGPLTTQPHLRDIPYDLDSFAPIGRIAVTPMLMMVPPSSKYQSLQNVLDDAKANPGKVKFASTGAGTLPHISILGLNKAASIETKHIPYKGSANVMKALLGGEVDVFSDQAQLVPKYDLRALACWSAARLPEYPDVPTMKELGFDFELENWLGVFVPKDTPQAVVDRLSSALSATLQDASVVAALDKLKVTIAHLGPSELAVFAKKDYDRNRDLLKDAGLLKK
ncbi:MAG: tripartite tricarboxylate transporter substrate binding protein [Ectothiorhodospiraceae bacterium]|nr:tripartite tricarboxylate transporter substrate binding protein [Chromatiales bacterium]MCP5154933.1 tripartite tricarboxylate transporter substrate binding protein [Ectothiorhodospiraceae bacterium]